MRIQKKKGRERKKDTGTKRMFGQKLYETTKKVLPAPRALRFGSVPTHTGGERAGECCGSGTWGKIVIRGASPAWAAAAAVRMAFSSSENVNDATTPAATPGGGGNVRWREAPTGDAHPEP
jgi:hypothetical protein